MGDRIYGYVPFGEFLPDLRYLANDGLVDAKNVVPMHGDYISAPATASIASLGLAANEQASALFVASANTNGYVYIVNAVAGYGDIKEITESGVVTNRTRTAANNYTSFALMTSGCSFGSNVIACLYSSFSPASSEPVQYLAPGAARFANLITSTFVPTAKFTFSFRANLFLAHCYLAAPYDTLAAGSHPTLAAWSQNENIRAFGSQNTDPQLVGADYQPLNFDIGEITGVTTSDEFAIIACSNGLVRVDGPPYTFRVVGRSHGMDSSALDGICTVGQDIYYVGPSGIMRLIGGEGVPERVGIGKFSRWLIDDTTGFSSAPLYTVPLSLRYDPLTDLLFFRYVSTDSRHAMLVYNIGENRASYWLLPDTVQIPQFMDITRITPSGFWCPGRDMRFVRGSTAYGKFAFGNSGMDAVLRRGYMQFNKEHPTRLIRIRPVYAVSDQVAIEQVSCRIYSTNKPYATATTYGPYTSLDGHGWIATPDTGFTDFHSPEFTVTAGANVHKVVEYQGFEYEAEVMGGRYSI